MRMNKKKLKMGGKSHPHWPSLADGPLCHPMYGYICIYTLSWYLTMSPCLIYSSHCHCCSPFLLSPGMSLCLLGLSTVAMAAQLSCSLLACHSPWPIYSNYYCSTFLLSTGLSLYLLGLSTVPITAQLSCCLLACHYISLAYLQYLLLLSFPALSWHVTMSPWPIYSSHCCSAFLLSPGMSSLSLMLLMLHFLGLSL